MYIYLAFCLTCSWDLHSFLDKLSAAWDRTLCSSRSAILINSAAISLAAWASSALTETERCISSIDRQRQYIVLLIRHEKYISVRQFCIFHLLTFMSFQTCITDFLLRNTIEDILKNVGNQTVSVFRLWLILWLIFDDTVEVSGKWNLLFTSILQNIFYCVPQTNIFNKNQSQFWKDIKGSQL